MRLATRSVLFAAVLLAPAAAGATDRADREDGVPLSMFGSYLRGGEFLVYPFFEYYRDNNFEYQPDEFGVASDLELRGRYRAHEFLLFLGYGLSDSLAVEIEAARIEARLDKSPGDRSALPARVEESGLGDVEAQLRWRWMKEGESRPELFSYFETVFPHAGDKALIGTSDWEFKLGFGLIRELGFATLTLRGAAEYVAEEGKLEAGEYALEALKRLSRHFRVFLALEGSQDELELITELQWHISKRVFVKLNNGLGLTSKATGWAPEVGIAFRF